MNIEPEDYVEHVGRESARFLDVLRDLPGPTRLPSCPDWDVDELLFHLAEVQHFWATIVAERLTGEDQVEQVRSERPGSRSEAETLVAQNTAALVRALRAAPAETAVWTWAPQQSVGFVQRRQAHEALIHRVDAELAAGSRTALNPLLAADGVDEVLDLMYGNPPSWGEFSADPARLVRFSALDTGHTWTVTVGRFTGTSPRSGEPVDVGCLGPWSNDESPTAEVVAAAGDLDCWLWNRSPLGAVDTVGDAATLAALDGVRADGIQ